MSDQPPADIIALVEVLERPGALWADVEAHLAAFPGWLQFVRDLREPPLMPMTRVVQMGPPVDYVTMTDDTRERLLEMFRPYAILLETGATPAERAVRLRQQGIDVVALCKEAHANVDSEISANAADVLEAIRSDRTLLRPSQSSAPANELLRSPKDGDVSAEDLLHASDAPQPQDVPHKPGLIERLFGKHGAG